MKKGCEGRRRREIRQGYERIEGKSEDEVEIKGRRDGGKKQNR